MDLNFRFFSPLSHVSGSPRVWRHTEGISCSFVFSFNVFSSLCIIKMKMDFKHKTVKTSVWVTVLKRKLPKSRVLQPSREGTSEAHLSAKWDWNFFNCGNNRQGSVSLQLINIPQFTASPSHDKHRFEHLKHECLLAIGNWSKFKGWRRKSGFFLMDFAAEW